MPVVSIHGAMGFNASFFPLRGTQSKTAPSFRMAAGLMQPLERGHSDKLMVGVAA